MVRSSYLYNPRCINAGNTRGVPVDTHRRYRKDSDLRGHKYFGGDVIAGTVDWAWAHKLDKGWNVLYTDGSAEFSSDPDVTRLVERINWSTGPSPRVLDTIMNLLE